MMKLLSILSMAIFCIASALANKSNDRPSLPLVSALDSTSSRASKSESQMHTTEKAEAWESHPILRNAKETNPEVMERLHQIRRDIVDNGCDINLCFALQGDDFITDFDFKSMKDFVELVIAITTTEQPFNLCAVQYGSIATPISELTSNSTQFLTELIRTERVGGLVTNITGAFKYIGSQLQDSAEDFNKVILLGDGIETIPFENSRPARALLNPDYVDICAVAVGQYDIQSLTDITGDASKIFRLGDFFFLTDAIFGLINNVCGLSL